MKHRKLQDLMSDKNLSPEDVAQFILYERNLNDNDKFKVICDLIVRCETVTIAKMQAERDKYREALERLLKLNTDIDNFDMGAIDQAEQALNSKEAGG